MAATTLPHPSRRVLGRLVVGIALVAILTTAFLAGRSQRSTTSISRPVPPISIPARIEPGLIGTVNSGPDNPEHSGASTSGGAGGNSSCATVVRHSRIC